MAGQVLALLLSFAALPAQTRLTGRILNARDNTPIRRAEVLLIRAGAPASDPVAERVRRTFTDVEGRYRFDAVETGRYELAALAPGYLLTYWGSDSADGRAKLFEAVGGDRSLDIKVQPQGVIAGRVRDEEGQPLTGVRIEVLPSFLARRSGAEDPVASDVTDDRGQFRIPELPPGRYILRGTPPMIRYEDAPDRGFVTTFAPATFDPAEARVFVIRPGTEMADAEFRFDRTPVFRIRGRVFGPQGNPESNARLRLYSQRGGAPSLAGVSFVDRQNGHFEISNAMPGNYLLSVEARGALHVEPIVVSRSDVTDYAVRMPAPAEVRLRAEWPDGARRQEFRLGLQHTLTGQTEWHDVAGHTRAAISPGRFRAVVAAPAGFSVAAIRLDGQDVTTGAFALNAAAAELQVELRRGGAELTGLVLGEDGMPAPGAVAVLPEDPEARSEFSVRTIETTPAGEFSIRGLPPGRYLVWAFDRISPDWWADPDAVRDQESRAARITVVETDVAPLTLPRRRFAD